MTSPNPCFDMIQEAITQNQVVLFMKGTPDMPLCGFSHFVSQVLQKLKIEFVGINVLSDEALRQAIKDFTNWPTIPQLYIKGEFVGGCDIVKEMLQSGEFITLLQDKNISFSTENMKVS